MERPLRFCMITTFFPPYSFGGDGIFVERLSNALVELGHRVEVIHCVDSHRLLSGREVSVGYTVDPRVRVHALRSRAGVLSPLATHQTGLPLFKRRRIARVLAAGFDVIHYHNISLVGGPGLLAMGRAVKVWTLHDFWLVCPAHVLPRPGSGGCSAARCVGCTLAHGRPPQWWRLSGLVGRSCSRVDALLAPSRFSQGVHRERLPGVHVRHLPGAPARPLPGDPPERNPAGRPGPFLFAGRLERVKGLHTLIPVIRAVRGARLWVAGEGSQEEALRRMAGGSPAIRFLGRLPEPDLRSLYRQCLAVVVPSQCQEVAPLVIHEAFSEGAPVIARAVGGAAELVEESGGGVLYAGEEDLRVAIERLLAEPRLAGEMGARARRFYQARLAPDLHLARYLELVRRLLERGAEEPRAAGAPAAGR